MKEKMRYLKIFLLLLIINIILFINGKVCANPYVQTGPYGTNCTWYVWQMASEKAGVTLPGWGNAKDWYKDAIKSGYKVGTEPASNSIVVWGSWTSYGHVGYVESVDENAIYVWDSTGPCIDENDPEFIDCIANAIDESTDRLCVANAKRIACEYTLSPDEYGITGYIYLDYKPSIATDTPIKNNDVSTQKNNTINQEKTDTNKSKSNNAYLKEISLSNGNIEFKKDVYKYNVEVENAINKIEVSATSEDKNAKIAGIGDYELTVGLNDIKLTVSAEDGSQKEYIIKVIRKNEIINEQEDNTNKEPINNNESINNIIETKQIDFRNQQLTILIITISLVGVFLLGGFIFYKRIHKK